MSLDAKEQGNLLFKQKHYAAAAHKFSEAIQLDNRNPVFYGNRAACYFFLKMFPETLRDCYSALQIDPSYRKAWLRKGDAHDELAQYGDSIESYCTALSLFNAHENDFDALKKRIEHVKGKILDPHYVSFDVLIILARLNGIVIPNLESIQTLPQIDSLRKALFRHPKWSFPIPSSSSNPHPLRIQFYPILPDERIPLPPHSNVEWRLGRDQMKTFDNDLRRLLGGCSAYTREVIFAEDWERCTSDKRWGTGIGRTHTVYELYCGHGTSSSEGAKLNRRACQILGRSDLCGPILVTKAIYIKTESQLLNLDVIPSSLSPKLSFQVSRNNGSNVLLGYDAITLEDLKNERLAQKIREWQSVSGRVTSMPWGRR